MLRRAAVVAVLTWSLSARGAVLTNPLQQQLRFDFSSPGARALGMGGAFLGRADDASAAEANPAGLSAVHRERSLMIEGRVSRTEARVLNGGLVGAAGALAPSTQLFNGATHNVTFA